MEGCGVDVDDDGHMSTHTKAYADPPQNHKYSINQKMHCSSYYCNAKKRIALVTTAMHFCIAVVATAAFWAR